MMSPTLSSHFQSDCFQYHRRGVEHFPVTPKLRNENTSMETCLEKTKFPIRASIFADDHQQIANTKNDKPLNPQANLKNLDVLFQDDLRISIQTIHLLQRDDLPPQNAEPISHMHPAHYEHLQYAHVH